MAPPAVARVRPAPEQSRPATFVAGRLFLSSAETQGHGYGPGYTASKGGVEMFTKVAAVELGRYDIRVNCVAPGSIEIERTKNEAGDYAATWSKLTPLSRVGKPRDIGRMVAFLASDSADFISGQTVWVDGGLFAKPAWPYD